MIGKRLWQWSTRSFVVGCGIAAVVSIALHPGANASPSAQEGKKVGLAAMKEEGVTTPFPHSAPLLARCAAAFARFPQTAMLHQRRAWAFVRSRNTSVQAEPSQDRISRKS
jgi:hypothetical protein